MVAGIDEGIGKIVEVLQSQVHKSTFCPDLLYAMVQKIRAAGVQGRLEETVIGFSIDNGGVPYAGALNYPLRGAKVRHAAIFKQDLELSFHLQSTLYEGGVRSPGFIHAPKILPR